MMQTLWRQEGGLTSGPHVMNVAVGFCFTTRSTKVNFFLCMNASDFNLRVHEGKVTS